MKKKNNNKKNTKKVVVIGYLVLISLVVITFILQAKLEEQEEKKRLELERQELLYNEIKSNYNTYVETTIDAKIYKLENGEYKDAGSISKGTKLVLDEKEVKDYQDIYFKLENIDYYVKYDTVDVIEEIVINTAYKNYIPFNFNVVTSNPAKLYSDDGISYQVNEELNLPVIINDTDKYYVEYDGKLLYVRKDEIAKTIEVSNANLKIADDIPVVLYHYVYVSQEEKKGCTNTIICHSYEQVSSHFKYLNDNNFYTLKMKEMEMWLDGKIQLPEKSVLVTIDDGWYVDAMRLLLDEYKVNATLFLITSLVPADPYRTKYLEVHGHTHNLHYTGACPGGQGSPLKCLDRNTILTDLSKNRELLNGSTYFAYPFYEYNSYAIGLLKEAGFTMAFRGGMTKAKQGVDKFYVPRITIHNTTTVEKFAQYIN